MKKYLEPSVTVLFFAHEDILSSSAEVQNSLAALAQEDGGNFGDFNLFS